jgi:beta-glucanase (GH16 family)
MYYFVLVNSRMSSVLAVIWVGLFYVGAFTARADWQLVWHDEFNGTSINTNAWWADLGPGPCINGNNELELYTNSPANLQVTNGMLRILGQNIGSGTNYILTSVRLMSENIDDCSGDLISNMTPSFVNPNGAVEWRAMLPQGTGLWPTLWLLPRENFKDGENAIEGNWPNSGEIDAMENDGSEPDQVEQNLYYYNGAFQSSESVSAVTNWHTYRLEWYTNQFNWYVDGVLGSTTTNWNAPPGYSYPAPFDAQSGGFYIIMNLALGGNFTGSPSAAAVAANLPAEMDIDYVRVYTRVNPVLSVARTNSGFIVSWLPQPAAWALEQTTSPTNAWTQVPAAQYQTNQNQIFFIVPPPLTNDMFYRLLQQ